MSELKRSAEALPRDNNKRPATSAQKPSPTCCMCIDNGNNSPRDGIIKLVCPCKDKFYCSDCYEGLVLKRPAWKYMFESKKHQLVFHKPPDKLKDDPSSKCWYCEDPEPHHCYGFDTGDHLFSVNHHMRELFCAHCNSRVDKFSFAGAPEGMPPLQITLPYGWAWHRPMMSKDEYESTEEIAEDLGVLEIFKHRQRLVATIHWHTHFPYRKEHRHTERYLSLQTEKDRERQAFILKKCHRLGISEETYHLKRGQKFKAMWKDHQMPSWLCDWRRNEPIPSKAHSSSESDSDSEEEEEDSSSESNSDSEEEEEDSAATTSAPYTDDNAKCLQLKTKTTSKGILKLQLLSWDEEDDDAHKTCQLTTGDGMQPVADGLTMTTNIIPLQNPACCLCTANGEDLPRVGIIKLVCSCPNNKLYCSDCYDSQVMARPLVEDIDISDHAALNERSSFPCMHCRCSVDRYCFAGTAADMPPMKVIFPVGWVYKRPCLEFNEYEMNERFGRETTSKRESLYYRIKSREQWLNHLRCEAGNYINNNLKDINFVVWHNEIRPKQKEEQRECKEEIEYLKKELEALEVPSGLCDWRIIESSQPDGWLIIKRDNVWEVTPEMNADLMKIIEEEKFVGY